MNAENRVLQKLGTYNRFKMKMKTMNCNFFKYIISQIYVMYLSVSNGPFISAVYG